MITSSNSPSNGAINTKKLATIIGLIIIIMAGLYFSITLISGSGSNEPAVASAKFISGQDQATKSPTVTVKLVAMPKSDYVIVKAENTYGNLSNSGVKLEKLGDKTTIGPTHGSGQYQITYDSSRSNALPVTTTVIGVLNNNKTTLQTYYLRK